MSFFIGYSHSFNLPVYANEIPEGWTQVTNNTQLVNAFKAYCKSRNFAIEGSVADAVTNFTTNTFNNLCKEIGIDIDKLQAEIAYKTSGNLGLQWFFTQSGISTYNRIFAELLQNNNLEVGNNVNDVVYSGKYFTGYDNYSCLVTITEYYKQTSGTSLNNLLYKGTYYKYNIGFADSLIDTTGQNFNVISTQYTTNNLTTTRELSTNATSYQNGKRITILSVDIYNNNSSASTYGIKDGYMTIFYVPSTDSYYYGIISFLGNNFYTGSFSYKVYPKVNRNVEIKYSTNNIISNQTTINNNNYENQTVIYEDGTYSSDPNYNPYPDGDPNPTPPSQSGGDGGNITFPNFNFDIPSINWSLGDLSNKFPFSIPFDLVAFYTILNAEPIAPVIDAHIPLGTWYDWHFEADFSQFENYAVIIRNVEYIGFVVTLIFITVKFVKG